MARDVKIAFLGDVSGLKKALADGEAAMKRNASAIQKTADTFDKAGNRLMGMGTALFASLGMMAKAADTAEKTNLKLSNSIQNSATLVASDKKAFDDLAVSLRGTTVASAGATKGAESILIQFGLTKDQVLQLTPLVVDLSRKMGIDMDTAAKMVAKSVGGNATALKRAGIAVDEVAFKTDAYNGTMMALRGSVGGFAEEEGKTFSGQLAIMKNELNAVAAGVGVGVLDAFKKVVGPVRALGDAFTSLPKPMQSMIGSTGAMAAGVLILSGVVAKSIAVVMRLGEQVGAVGNAAGRFMKIDFAGRWDDSATKATKSMVTLNGVMSAGIALAGAAAAAWALWSQRQEELTREGKDVQKMLDDQISKGALSFRQLGVGADAAKQSFKDFKKEAGDVSWYEVWNLDYKKAMDTNADASSDMALKMTLLQGVAQGLADKLGITTEKATAMAQRNMAAGRAVDDVRGAIETENEELQKQADAFDKALQAAKGYFDFAKGQTDATLVARQATRDFNKALAENGPALDDTTDKGYANVQSLRSAISAWQDWGLQQIKAGADIGETTAKVNGQIGSLEAQAATVGVNKQQFDFWRASLAATPTDISTAFSTPGLAEANAAIRELLGNLSALGQGEQIMRQQAQFFQSMGLTSLANQYNHAADMAAQAASYTRANIPGRAVGGGATAGGMYLVGERGPELLQMGNRSGRVIPNGQAAAAGSSIVVNVGGSVVSERDLVESIGEALRRREVARL